MRARLWPAGLIGRVGLVLFAALVLELIGSAVLFEQAETLVGDQNAAQRIADGVVSAARVLTLTPAANRPSVADTLSEKDLALRWHDQAGAVPSRDAASEALREKIVAVEPSLAPIRLAPAPGGVSGTLPLPDGSVLAFRADVRSSVPAYLNQLWSIGLLSGAVLLAALLVVRTLGAPLRMLVTATDAIGHGPAVALTEDGPREVRRVARAFNAMQARIARLIADRTQALAAVSHDLRTPIGRMRLRAGFLSPGEDRAAFESDLAEMEAMLADLFAYLGGDADPEQPRRTDLAVTLATLVDDATDAGRAASYEGPEHLVIEIRALALKRALSNLVNNAIDYGDRARVTLRATADTIAVDVEDDGPGIPDAAERAAVLEPFYRGDASRNRAKGGMGLGLAITRAAILREGGTIALETAPGGGLRVEVRLPGTSFSRAQAGKGNA